MSKRAHTANDGSILFRQHQQISDMAIDHLAHVVDEVVRDVCAKLGGGLPRSVYLAGVLNHLGQLGLTLETEMPSIGVIEQGRHGREIFVVEGRVMIECILEHELSSEMEEVYRSRLGFDVKARACELGMVINFGRYTGGLETNLH